MKAVSSLLFLALTPVLFIGEIAQPAYAQPNWAHAIGQRPHMVDVSTRQEQMLKNLKDAVAHGRLTQNDADSLITELERIKQCDIQYRVDGKLTIWQRMRIAFDLDNLQIQIDSKLSPTTAALSDIPEHEANITREIADALFTGRLTRTQGDLFLAQLDEIQSKQATYEADGPLNQNELLALSLDLDKLQQDVHNKIKPIDLKDVGSDSQKVEIRNRLKALMGSGKITIDQSNKFTDDLNDIEAREMAFKNKDGKLDTNECLTIAIELERLSGKLNRYQPEYTSQSPSVDQREQEIEKLITDALYSGKMTSLQVYDLKQDFDRVAALEATFRIDGTLSEAETLTLTRDLDSLKAKIELYTGSDNHSVDQRLAEARKRLGNAEAAGRLEPSPLKDLHEQMEKIEARQKEFLQDGKLDTKETLALNTDIDAFRISLDRSLKPLPDISAKRAVIERRINDGQGDGRLRPDDAKTFKADLVRINGIESAMRGAESGLSDQAIFALAKELDSLLDRIDKALPVLPDIPTREASILARINEAARNGTITEDNRRDFTHEFERIKDVETAFRSSDSGLSDWEALTVSQDLDRLEADLRRTITVAPKASAKTKGKDASGDSSWKMKPQK